MKNFVTISLVLLACVAANHAYKVNSRIFEGKPAKLGQFPFYAFLNVRFSNPRHGTACGASLISDEWLVTAAHCLSDASVVKIDFGESNLINSGPQNVLVEVGPEGLHPHPNYFASFAVNDIGKRNAERLNQRMLCF